MIAVDTLRADHIGGYGYDEPTSPRIDAFMDTAVVFEDAQATSSWTLASFASLMTALYPSSHRCTSYASRLDPSYVRLAEILSDHGYSTAGVVSHIFLGRKYGLHQGFRHFDESLVRSNLDLPNQQISSPEVTNRALDWLRAHDAPEPGTFHRNLAPLDRLLGLDHGRQS